ncbi:MAG: hypothetical protein AAGF15_10340, partial [Pseudomonadota bacterium]
MKASCALKEILNAIGLSLLVASLAACDAGEVQLRLSGPSIAKGTLVEFGVPDGSQNPSKIEHSFQDGTLPEIARQTFSSGMSDVDIRDHYTSACQKNGFSAPSDDRIKIEPNLLCFRQDERGLTNFLMTLSCTGDACFVML